jgi:hypothetical protein
MKYSYFLFFSVLLSGIFLSCKNFPIPKAYNESWYTGAYKSEKQINYGKVYLNRVYVDRSGNRDSIQDEIYDLAKLVFWTNGLNMVSEITDADFAADIRLHEREYISQWKTKRSLSLELRLWALSEEILNNFLLSGDRVFDDALPLAAARAVSTGNRSFLSSYTSGRYLSQVVRNTVKQLKGHNE